MEVTQRSGPVIMPSPRPLLTPEHKGVTTTRLGGYSKGTPLPNRLELHDPNPLRKGVTRSQTRRSFGGHARAGILPLRLSGIQGSNGTALWTMPLLVRLTR